MEQLNQVILRGHIGAVVTHETGTTEVARFSMSVQRAFRNRNGEAVVDTTWIGVTAFKGDRMPDFSALKKGSAVEVKGRLRNNKITTPEGDELTCTEVSASEINIL